MRIILASQSPRRVRVLKTLGIKFDTIPSDFDEDSVKGLENDPAKLVERLALEKARKVAKKNQDALVIGGDNVVVLDGKIVGKPKNLDEARKILRRSRGNMIKAHNGIAVIYKSTEKSTATDGIARFKNYSEGELSNHLRTGNPLDKAGGFAGDPAEGGLLLERFEGEPGEELGLPLTTLKKFLTEFGLKV